MGDIIEMDLLVFFIKMLRSEQNGHFADDIFIIFINENQLIFIKSSLSFVPSDPSDKLPASIWVSLVSGINYLSENWSSSKKLCGVSRPQWVKIWLPITVFEITWWTGARDQQKWHRSSKTSVLAGPKDQQLVLYFGNSHCPNFLPNTFQSSKQFNDLTFHGSQL